MTDTEIEETVAEEMSSADRLHAAHEKHLGKNFTTHNGRPEMGHGSRHAALHPAHKAHIAAIEHLIAMEAEHASAESALATAHEKVTHAMAHVEATEEASDAEYASHKE